MSLTIFCGAINCKKMKMIKEVKKLIAEGKTESATSILIAYSEDAKLLQARFNAGKKQYNTGLIEFGEWQRTQAQINYAVLKIASQLK